MIGKEVPQSLNGTDKRFGAALLCLAFPPLAFVEFRNIWRGKTKDVGGVYSKITMFYARPYRLISGDKAQMGETHEVYVAWGGRLHRDLTSTDLDFAAKGAIRAERRYNRLALEQRALADQTYREWENQYRDNGKFEPSISFPKFPLEYPEISGTRLHLGLIIEHYKQLELKMAFGNAPR